MDEFSSLQSLYWILAASLVCFWGLESVLTWRSVSSQKPHPLIGCRWPWKPRLILNWVFAKDAATLIEEGYQKVKDQSYSFGAVFRTDQVT